MEGQEPKLRAKLHEYGLELRLRQNQEETGDKKDEGKTPSTTTSVNQEDTIMLTEAINTEGFTSRTDNSVDKMEEYMRQTANSTAELRDLVRSVNSPKRMAIEGAIASLFVAAGVSGGILIAHALTKTKAVPTGAK